MDYTKKCRRVRFCFSLFCRTMWALLFHRFMTFLFLYSPRNFCGHLIRRAYLLCLLLYVSILIFCSGYFEYEYEYKHNNNNALFCCERFRWSSDHFNLQSITVFFFFRQNCFEVVRRDNGKTVLYALHLGKLHNWLFRRVISWNAIVFRLSST